MVDAWSELRETIKIGILAMVKAAHLEWWKTVGAGVWGLDHGRSSQSWGPTVEVHHSRRPGRCR